MSPRPARLAFMALGCTALAVCWWSLARLADARARADLATHIAAAIERDAARLETLRTARPTVGQGAEPQADALDLLNAAMGDAGLPATHLRSLAPDAQAQLSGGAGVRSGYQRRSLRLTLGALTLPDLGRFLQSWRATQEVWTISQISLRREAAPRARSLDQWTATMTLSATYLNPDNARGMP